ncbi:MAG: 30S ribosomal protein S21 [Patescibacteria group bacterium]
MIFRTGGVCTLPIVIKAKSNQNTNDVIRQFKKAVSATDIVQRVKDRRYFARPSKTRAIKKEEIKKSRKRAKIVKKMKNAPVRKPAPVREQRR